MLWTGADPTMGTEGSGGRWPQSSRELADVPSQARRPAFQPFTQVTNAGRSGRQLKAPVTSRRVKDQGRRLSRVETPARRAGSRLHHPRRGVCRPLRADTCAGAGEALQPTSCRTPWQSLQAAG